MSTSTDAPPRGSPDVQFTIRVRNHNRTVQLHWPEAYYNGAKKLPLILAFHGKNQLADTFAVETGLSDYGVNRDYMVAYPQGIDKKWIGSPDSPSKEDVDDVVFVRELLDYLCQQYPVDPDRVFVLGYSNGAGLAALIACDKRLSRRIRAVAMSASAIFLDEALIEPMFNKFEATRFPLPLIEFHGDADPVIDYNGVDTPDGPSWPIGDWLRCYTWSMEKGLNDGQVVRDEAEETHLFDGKVERYAWRCGTDHEIVVHYLLHGFGHGWPTTTPLANDEIRNGPTVIDATPIALEFFSEAAMIKPYDIDWND